MVEAEVGQQGATPDVGRVGRRQVETRHFGLEAVDEEVRVGTDQQVGLGARHARVYQRLQVAGADRVVQQREAILDLDEVDIGREAPGIAGREDGAGREARRLFGLERHGAERDGNRVVHRVGAIRNQRAGRIGGRRDVERVDLSRRRRTEARVDGRAQCKLFVEVIAAGDLEIKRRIELVVVLGTQRERARELLREIGLEIDVGEDAVALEAARGIRRESLEAVRADAEDGGGGPGLDRGRITGTDVIGLVAPAAAESDVERRAVEGLDEIGLQAAFLLRQRAGTEFDRRQPAEARVDGLADHVIDFVLGEAAVHIPGQRRRKLATSADHEREVGDVGAEVRVVTAREQREYRVAQYEAAGAGRARHVTDRYEVVGRIQALLVDAVDERLVRRIGQAVAVTVDLQGRTRLDLLLLGRIGQDRRPVEKVGDRLVVHEGRETIQRGRVRHVDARVHEQLEGLDRGIAPALPEAVQRHLVRADEPGHLLSVRARHAAIRNIGIRVFGSEVEETVFGEGQAEVAADGKTLTLGVVGLAVLRRRREAGRIVLEDDVDDARDRIGTVLRRGAVTQDLDALDGRGREGRPVHRLRALVHRTERRQLQVDERRAMPARAVHQHERVVGRQVAQADRPDQGRAVRDRKTLRVQRRRDPRQRLGQVERRLVLHAASRQYINRRQRLGRRHAALARAGRDDLFDEFTVRCALRDGSLLRQSEDCCGQNDGRTRKDFGLHWYTPPA